MRMGDDRVAETLTPPEPIDPLMDGLVPRMLALAAAFGVEVGIGPGGFTLDGFYKHGTVRLRPTAEPGVFVLVDRYGEEEEVATLRDLVWANHGYWRQYRDRLDMWSMPAGGWAELMVAYGLVERRARTVVEYADRGGGG